VSRDGPDSTFESVLELLLESASETGGSLSSEPEEELASPSQSETFSIPPARFIITSPYTQQPVEVTKEGDEITLGRAGSSDIVLDYDTLTSRHHALLKREDEHYVIYDLRSFSGVFVNGHKLAVDVGQLLSVGDHIRIGNYELIFRPHEEETRAEADQANSETESSMA